MRPLIAVEVFIDQGGFDAVGLPTVAVEDQEFSFRVAAAGHRLVFVPEAIVYHQHNTSLWRYFRRKVNISYWKTFILRRHPTKALRDSHTPQMIKVQIALLAAALLMTLAALLLGSSMPIGPGVPIGLWAAFCLSMGPLLIKIARRDPPVLLVAPLMITLRALALGLGMFMGLLRFHVFRRSPRRPALNMKAWLVFLAVGVAALMLYLSTAAPSLTWAHSGADGGDLISAALTNGVAHPPGYPTYVTIGQWVARMPFGDMAYRFTVLSAVSMALAAGFTTLSILALSRQPLVAIVAGLFFATAPMVWGQATITEVYALNAAFVATIVYLITPIVFRRESVSLFRLALAAWLWGVAFGNSVTVAALAPLLIVAWWRARTSTSARRVTWLPLLAFAIGLSVYLLIPLRAAAQPFVNWGDATTPDRFFALISAELYRGYALSTAPQEFLTRIVAFAQLLVMQYGWLGVALGAIGLYHALISSNRNWRWLALTIALYLLFALSYNTPDSALYLIPVWMFGAWAIARGMLSDHLCWNKQSQCKRRRFSRGPCCC